MFSLILEVTKNLKDPLIVKQSSAYKKGFKKHKHDKRVMTGIKDILKYLIYHKDLPHEYNDHILKNGNMKGLRSAHIKGQQVVILYNLTDTSVELLGLGSHNEIGTM